jgi:hypothetical protein
MFGLAQASARTAACSGNGPVRYFTLTLPSANFTATAGTAFHPTVTAVTSCGATAVGYNGSGTLSSNLAASPNGTNPTVPSPINFVGGISSPSVIAVKAVSDGSARLTFSASGFTAVQSLGFSVNPGPPDHVEFAQQPNFNTNSSWLLNTKNGSLTQFAATVNIYDAFENLATQENGPDKVTLALNQATGLTGQLANGSSKPTDGVAKFTNLTVDQTNIGYTLTASYKSATTATSAPFSVFLTTNQCNGACSINQFNVDPNTTTQVQGNGSFSFLGVATVNPGATGMPPPGCTNYAADVANGAPAPAVVADMRTAVGGTLTVTYGISKTLLQKLFGSTSGSQFVPICVGARRIALVGNQVVAVNCNDSLNGQPQTAWLGKTLDNNGKFVQGSVSPAQCDSTLGDPGYGYWWGIIGSFQDATSSNPALEIDPSINPTVTGWSSGSTYRFFTIQFPASSGGPSSPFANNPWDSWMW